LCVRPSMSVEALVSVFLGNHISGAPVVDRDGKAIGVVSKTDALLARGSDSVADIMTPIVLMLSESAPVSRAAALMAYEGVHRIIVTSDDGRVVGVLGALDVLRHVASERGYVIPTRAFDDVHRSR
jgi:CBS domain-containing protein